MALEFRSQMDDAWYDARIVMDGYDCLRVKFIGFPDDHDEVFDANNLTSFKDIAEFRRRFRPVSVQVQDNECSQVAKGTLVCVAHAICPDDRRFYDAVVYKVLHEEHRFVKGEEECSCSFILFWRHGPKAGCLTVQDLENICRVQPRRSKMNPLLTSFLETAREKIEITLSKICATPHEAAYDEKACRPSVSQRLKQDTSTSRRPSSLISSLKEMNGNPSQRAGHVREIEGIPHMIIVDNLDRGLSPLKIVEFIHKKVSISCEAFVLPCMSSEWYTRGTILVDSKTNVDKLSDFLEGPDHIIISSSGRPWVMTEKTRVHEPSIKNFMLISQKQQQSRSETMNELKVKR
ncbi:hypothetical protein L3X38_019324 [Prunus dulcis]|uniref:SAWADEE domain-containing protein n=1 Tax=Prunus dulcis TaxID=3755 RepID=A0AAD4WAQ7_PRUDU|nr:hypothetical protein L3X38_019324 [Prunus dulcis]